MFVLRQLLQIEEFSSQSAGGGKEKKQWKINAQNVRKPELPIHAMKPHGRVELYLHSFLSSTLDGGEWSASRSGCFVPEVSAQWDPESVWTVLRGEKCPVRTDSRTTVARLCSPQSGYYSDRLQFEPTVTVTAVSSTQNSPWKRSLGPVQKSSTGIARRFLLPRR